MDSLELIDDYFKGILTGEQQKQVEQRILSDPAFAEELAFYLSAHDAVKQELNDDKRTRFSELYQESKTAAPRRQPVRRLYILAAAAAAVLILIIGDWGLFYRHPKPQQLADDFIAR